MSSSRPEPDALRRLLGDVQQLGLATAASVIDRFSGMVRGLGAAARGADDRSWTAAAGTLAGAAQAMVHAPPPSDCETVVLAEGRNEGVATGTVWLHNTTAAPATGLTLHCSDLVGPGAPVPATAVTLSPSGAATVPAGSSVPIGIEVKIPPGRPAGVYHGLLVMSGPSDGAVVLRLSVSPREMT